MWSCVTESPPRTKVEVFFPLLGLGGVPGDRELVLYLDLLVKGVHAGAGESGGELVTPQHVDDPGGARVVIGGVQEDCLPVSHCGGGELVASASN